MKAKSGKLLEGVKPIKPKTAMPADEADPGKAAKTKATQIQQKKGKYGETKAPPYKPIEPSDKASGDGQPEKETPTSFLSLSIVDEDKNPIIGMKYEVILPDGSMASGTTGTDGGAKIEGFEEGKCTVSFPDIDEACISKK